MTSTATSASRLRLRRPGWIEHRAREATQEIFASGEEIAIILEMVRSSPVTIFFGFLLAILAVPQASVQTPAAGGAQDLVAARTLFRKADFRAAAAAFHK